MKIKRLIQLFVSFLKIGMIAFGGGYAVAPLLQKEAVESREWITNEELTDIMAIAQTLPGAIFTNSATMIGYRVSGFFGALVATTSSVLPTFIITILVTVFFWDYTDNPIVKKAFAGVLVGVAALILHSITKMWKSAVTKRFDILLVALSSAGLLLFKINAVYVILGIAALGFSRNLTVYRSRREKA
ncbi:MAG: chromate transporter [Clostridiales bacterium]|nr:chromate transporter [Eubacteriales bacterium]MDH7566436.1 chromate transporter [Clostridiales bacterium]